jgi:hypothetical protein
MIALTETALSKLSCILRVWTLSIQAHAKEKKGGKLPDSHNITHSNTSQYFSWRGPGIICRFHLTVGPHPPRGDRFHLDGVIYDTIVANITLIIAGRYGGKYDEQVLGSTYFWRRVERIGYDFLDACRRDNLFSEYPEILILGYSRNPFF